MFGYVWGARMWDHPGSIYMRAWSDTCKGQWWDMLEQKVDPHKNKINCFWENRQMWLRERANKAHENKRWLGSAPACHDLTPLTFLAQPPLSPLTLLIWAIPMAPVPQLKCTQVCICCATASWCSMTLSQGWCSPNRTHRAILQSCYFSAQNTLMASSSLRGAFLLPSCPHLLLFFLPPGGEPAFEGPDASTNWSAF